MVSQSLIKDFKAYSVGDMCGLVLKDRHVHHNYSEPPTNAMNLGCYFEYTATGALPKSGEVPKAKIISGGKLGADYKRASEQAERFNEMCKRLGIQITSAGEYLSDGLLEGTRDLGVVFNKGENKGKKATIDLKYSGRVDDEYNSTSWGAMINPNASEYRRDNQIKHHSIQALHYMALFGDPFYYWVFSSGANQEQYLIEFKATDMQIRAHRELSQSVNDRFEYTKIMDMFEAKPNYNRCSLCYLKDGCTQKSIKLEEITINI